MSPFGARMSGPSGRVSRPPNLPTSLSAQRRSQEIISHRSIKCTTLLLGAGSATCLPQWRARSGIGGMLYQAYQAHTDVMVPVRNWAGAALRTLGQPLGGIADNAVLRNLTAAYELIARAGLTHARPPFGIDRVAVGNREVAVHEEAALTTPFGTLLRFRKDIDTAQPRVLLVAPLSGHFSTPSARHRAHHA